MSIRDLVLGLALTAFALATPASAQDPLDQILDASSGYFNTESTTGSKLTQLDERVWTFNHYFDRGLIIEGDTSLIIVDSFNKHYVNELLRKLRAAGINKPVGALIYTHYHMDHTAGGALLQADRVYCDTKCSAYWDAFPQSDTGDIAAPTHLLSGDKQEEIDGVTINFVNLGRSHTNTMYAVHLPKDGILFAADTVGVRTLLPTGGISLFYPDYLAALDKLQALQFETFVSSHFAWGTKSDFDDAAQLQRDAYQWVREAVAMTEDHESGKPLYQDKERMKQAFGYFAMKMQAKYGDWHGFQAQIFNTFTNALVAIHIGS